MLRRKDSIERVASRIERLRERAATLLEEEQRAIARVDELRAACEQPAWRLRSARLGRSLARAEREVASLKAQRAQLTEAEIRKIMLALQERARLTREHLDQALKRLGPVQAEWEQLRSTFDALEAAVASPALEALTGQWRGGLEIPEFPVREHEGYTKPFPQQAVVF